MKQLLFLKGLWLTVVTSVVILGLALAGTLASLGCGGGEDGEDEPEQLRADVVLTVTFVDQEGQPVEGELVTFRWQISRMGDGQWVTRSPIPTSSVGWASFAYSFTVREYRNVYIDYSTPNAVWPLGCGRTVVSWHEIRAEANAEGLATFLLTDTVTMPPPQ